jgi:glycosyltransferase involved in cell wall biosynthesis
VAEAMLAGTPVIASQSGSLPEVVGEGGHLVREGDVHQLADLIEVMVNDASTRAFSAARAREWARKRFDPKVEAGRIVGFWEDSLSRQ